jgi:hypothetical protein
MIFRRTPYQHVFDFLLRVPMEVLNEQAVLEEASSDSRALDVQLKHHAARIKAEAIDPETGMVSYAYLRDSQVYRDYRALTAQLATFDLTTLHSREQRLAFWLNLYNALVVDGIIHYGLQRSVTEMPGFFRQTAYNVGGYRFSLDDIEHGILRANKGHLYIPGAQFPANDPRRVFALDHVDFRIHFALVCGAVSCPPISFYDADKIDAQLDLATRNFLANNLRVDIERCLIRASRLLQWYGQDFVTGRGLGRTRELLRTLQPYWSDEPQRAVFSAPDVRIKFTPYDWSLNAL